MKILIWLLLSFFLYPCLAMAQNPKAPQLFPPDETTKQIIQKKQQELKELLRRLPKDDLRNPSVTVYHKAIEWIDRYQEYYSKDSGKGMLAVLDEGLRRANGMLSGTPTFLEPTNRSVSRAYRSRIDGSVQPYAISFPSDYGQVSGKKYRLDIVLHGRDATLTEVKFLNQHNGSKTNPKDQTYIQVDVYGRGNNAYRWAGEEDIFEVLDHVRAIEKASGRRDLLDDRRVVLRGFSMGGAGTWHIGLHHPDRFCVLGPGAGFTTTHGYIAKLPKPLPSPQEEGLHIYDAVDYAENAFHVPIIAYSGEKDPQKAAADNIEKALQTRLGRSFTHLIGPGLEHKFPPEWQQKAEVEYAKFAGEGQGRKPFPTEIRFVTYTMKYPRCEWLEILGLDKHYSYSLVHAKYTEKKLEITTQNIHSLAIQLPQDRAIPKQIQIDNQVVESTSSGNFVKNNQKWMPVTENTKSAPSLRKQHRLQGPIDDAFTDSFICVLPSKQGWHSAHQIEALAIHKRFEKEWDQFFRGKIRTVQADEITDSLVAENHLILFGDPSSNPWINKILDKLPIGWTQKELTWNGKTYDSTKYLPVLIYPNPWNSKKYIVVNSGHTFHEAEFRGTNAQLYPRLGDYALLKRNDNGKYQVEFAGLFDESWQFSKDQAGEKK